MIYPQLLTPLVRLSLIPCAHAEPLATSLVNRGRKESPAQRRKSPRHRRLQETRHGGRPSPIRTIPSAPELHRILGIAGRFCSARPDFASPLSPTSPRGLYRRSGIEKFAFPHPAPKVVLFSSTRNLTQIAPGSQAGRPTGGFATRNLEVPLCGHLTNADGDTSRSGRLRASVQELKEFPAFAQPPLHHFRTPQHLAHQ
jgi:hypothetical protein